MTNALSILATLLAIAAAAVSYLAYSAIIAQ